MWSSIFVSCVAYKYDLATNVQVTTPLLKFMAEFVLNKTQRLTFDISSPNGILLFREVSKLLVAYGTRILSVPTTNDIYAYRYKGIWISLTILARGKRLYVYAVKYRTGVPRVLLLFWGFFPLLVEFWRLMSHLTDGLNFYKLVIEHSRVKLFNMVVKSNLNTTFYKYPRH